MGRNPSNPFLGVSNVSELQYADDWDEYSFNSSGNVSRNVSRDQPAASRDQSKASNYEWTARGSVLDVATKTEPDQPATSSKTRSNKDASISESKTSLSALPTIDDDDEAVGLPTKGSSGNASWQFDSPEREKPSQGFQSDDRGLQKASPSGRFDELEKEKASPAANSNSSMYDFEESPESNASPGRRPRRNRGQL
jgi:hypothetical protein